MKRLTLMSFALSALAASPLVPTASHASPPVAGPTGPQCRYTAVPDTSSNAPPDGMIAEIVGGPMIWNRAFRLHCTIQVNSDTHNGSDAVDAHATATATGGGGWVAVMPPNDERATTFSYRSSEFDQDYLCTSVSFNGGTYYWSAANDGPDQIPGTADDVPGFWSADATRRCDASAT